MLSGASESSVAQRLTFSFWFSTHALDITTSLKESQTSSNLDRAERCQQFNLATLVQDPADRQAAVQTMEEVIGSSDQADDDDGGTLIHRLAGFISSQVDYFTQDASLLKGEAPLAPQPYQTFAVEDAAFT